MAKYTLRSRKPKVPAWLCYVTAALYVVCGVLLLLWLVSGFVWGYLAGVIGVVLWLVLLGNCLSWYSYAELEEFGDRLEYRYFSAADMGGLGKSVYTVKSVIGYRLRRSRLVVYGDISVKEPMHKAKQVSRVVIYDYTKECEELLSKWRGKC